MTRNILIGLAFLLLVGCGTTKNGYEVNPVVEVEKPLTMDTPQEKRQNLPKDYKGDSIITLIDKIKLYEESSKDEYKKTSEKNAEFSSLCATPYRFVISQEMNNDWWVKEPYIRYDADKEVLIVDLRTGNEKFMSQTRTYDTNLPEYPTVFISKDSGAIYSEGINAFGVKIDKYTTTDYLYGLAFANVKRDIHARLNDIPLFSLLVPIKANEAKALKEDLSFYIDAELTTSPSIRAKILNGNIGCGRNDICGDFYILVNVKEIGVFRVSSGEVLKWKRF